MRAEEIRDRKTLEAWLRDQPREVALMIAARAALRVVPLWSWYLRSKPTLPKVPGYAAALFRFALTSCVATGNAKQEMRAVARAAGAATAADATTAQDTLNFVTRAARNATAAGAAAVRAAAAAAGAAAASAAHAATATDAAATAAYAAVRAADGSASAATSAAEATWDAVRADLEAVERGTGTEAVLSSQLWSSDRPAHLIDQWQVLRRALLADHADWQFWIDWYERVLRGDPQNWDMLTEIVLIPDADWKQGPRHVNALIAGIVERHRGGGAGKRVEDLPPPAAARLQAQVAFLLQTSACAEVTAAGLSAQIAHAITVYKRDERCNQLPEPLMVFEYMADTLHRLSRTVAKATDDPDEVAALKQQILDLEAQIETLTGKLRAAEHRDDFARFWDAGVESAGKWAGPAAMGGLVYFVGNYVDPGMLNQLGAELARWAQAVRGARG